MDQLSDALLLYTAFQSSSSNIYSTATKILQPRMSTHFPNLQPDSSYSFYPYPLTGVSSTSSILRGLASPTPIPEGAGPSRDRSAEIRYAEKLRQRAEKRAVVGLRPAGLAVGRESEALDMEEMRLEDEKVGSCPTADRVNG